MYTLQHIHYTGRPSTNHLVLPKPAATLKSVVFLGEGSVTLNRMVTDNQWHSVEWSRKYKKIALVLDGTDRGESRTPGVERLLGIACNGEIFVNISRPEGEGKRFHKHKTLKISQKQLVYCVWNL